MDAMRLYRIAWRSKLTGATGCTNGCTEYMSSSTAQATLKNLEDEFGHICYYWLEQKPNVIVSPEN